MQTLYFTVKEWSKFDWNKQQILTAKYIVILTDYKTKKKRVLEILDKINFKNFDKGLLMFNKSIQKFGGSMDALTREFPADAKSNKSAKLSEKKNLEKIWGKNETME